MTTHTGMSPQVRLANEIAVHFHHQPPEQAAAAIAEHIRAFWDPRMRAELRLRAEAEPEALDPLALAAARLLTG
ncbi:formate dehydrogenase subunit delta [Plantactinospora sp. KLBMP9567]|uniref:formate dehydrogenase subunit delta n=2 Tax=unclassified Plantactinospora TaxID=2631981 RepID=UPI002981527F|nr:formate dehydrogenase subunit delta [Plantactinospora sp. KLBMP9567]MDW5328012.1 formate dehydrogenase subunit delta [Plantactinospora sp. KLBMP9567]